MSAHCILMVAFHFPPLKASSGLQRTLNFSRYLAADHGWQPIVLTASARAYRTTSDEQLEDTGSNTEVVRSFALDATRHLSIRGRYPGWLALPDPWASWWMPAVIDGIRMVRRYRPKVIWSTYPIATAHMIANTIHRISGLPWIADFRDSMTEEGYPESKSKWKCYRKIEARAVTRSAAAVFTTPGARQMYQERYPSIPADRLHVIENGFDESAFPKPLELDCRRHDRNRIELVHSGLLYRSERDPSAFFAAVASLKRTGEVSRESLRVTLRASGDENHHERKIQEYGIGDIVRLAPPIDYRAALKEMVEADGLLLFQAADCNHQIPAKLYEYLHAQRPILALTDPAGDTAQKLKQAGTGIVVHLDDEQEIVVGLRKILNDARQPTARTIDTSPYTRRGRTNELATLLEKVIN